MGSESGRRRPHAPRAAVHPPLVARVQNGSRPAFGELVRLFQDRLFALALSVTGDASAAREAACEGLVRAHAEFGVLTDVNQVPAFLAERVRRAANPPSSDADDDWLARVLALRRPDERAATLLVLLAGSSTTEVAELLDLPEPTVANRLTAAKRGLKRRAWERVPETVRSTLPSLDSAFEDEVLARIPQRP